MRYTWTNNPDDEIWGNDCFDTIEECIKDAVSSGYKKGDTIAIGEVVEFIPRVSGYSVLDGLETDAYEECGEVSEGWIDYSKEEVEKLSDKLTSVIQEWLKETNQEPTFYSIQNIKVVFIVEKNKDKVCEICGSHDNVLQVGSNTYWCKHCIDVGLSEAMGMLEDDDCDETTE